MKRCLALLFIVLFSFPAHAVTQAQLEAVFLEKFTHLIDWPNTSTSDEFTICILNNKKFAETLKRIYENKKFHNKDKVTIIHLNTEQQIPQCQLLFISKETKDVTKALKKVAGRPILTVSNDKDRINDDVMITMFPVENRFKYIINNKAAQDVDINISYLLLKSAHKVIK